MFGDWMGPLLGVLSTAGAVISGVVGKLWLEVDRLRKEVMECEKHRAKSEAELTFLYQQVGILQQTALGTSARPQDVVVVGNENQVIVEWSFAAVGLFGWSAEEAIGKKVADLLIPADLREKPEAAYISLVSSSKIHTSHRLQNVRALMKSGKEFHTDIKLDGWKTGSRWTLVAVFYPRYDHLQND